jgi:hypothetical protein
MPTSPEPFDETAKAYYRQLFENLGLVVETELKVFFRERAIDLVVKCTEEDRRRLQNTAFSHFRQVNAIELKGINDPLTLIDYNKIMMRAWGLGAFKPKPKPEDDKEEEQSDDKNEPNPYPSQRTLTIICVTRPTKILDQLETEVKFTKQSEGIYHCPDGFSQRIIHPSELPIVPQNYPLLPLAQGEKLEQFMALCLRENLVNYLQLIMDIGITTDPNVILRQILETKQMSLTLHEDTRYYLNQYFLEMPEEMTKIPTFQDALAISERQGEQSVLRTLRNTLVRQLHRKFAPVPDNVRQEIETETTNNLEQLDNWLDQIFAISERRGEQQQGAVRTLRNTLIRQLHRKFAPVPDNVVQKIETTNNLEQLGNWLDQILIADSLAETELINTEKAKKT